MKNAQRLYGAALVCLALSAPSALASDLRAAMEADNARWLAAFNAPNPADFVAMYTSERTPLAGNTVRVFERQADGGWLTKVHIYNRY